MRLGWWENTVTNHADVRSAFASALTRSVDVDEDIGAPPNVSVVRVRGGVGREKLATTLAMAQVPVRANARGWELTAHPSLESRRTAGWLREVSDAAEEMLPGRVDRLMLHVDGPWSVGANVEYRGHAVVEDRPAFRDMALHLGEGVREFARLGERIGADVVLAVHEPRVVEVLRGLEGSTEFDPVQAVDREIVAGVWQRFLDQVGVGAGDGVNTAVLDCEGFVPEEVADVLPGIGGFTRVVVPSAQLDSAAGKDLIGGLLGQLIPQGRGIGWADSRAGAGGGADVAQGAGSRTGGGANVTQEAEDIAKAVLRQWSQWTLPADALPGAVDVVVPEATRTIAEASMAAARARLVASLLWKN